MFKKTTLENGLRIIEIPSQNTNSITALVMVGTGSKYETKELSGISHFLEHLQFKGTKKRPTEMNIFSDIDSLGGVANAFTGTEFTGYYAKAQSQKAQTALELIADIYLNSTLPAAEIEKERGTIIEEINMFYDHPMRHIWTVWNHVLYGDQPAGWDIAGTKETVKSITRDQLVAYRDAQYVAPNTIVCVAGNFESEKIQKLVRECFSNIPKEKSRGKTKVDDSQTKPRVAIYKKQTEQTQTNIGVRAYSYFHPKRYALEILDVVLGGMWASRLKNEVRIKRGLAYDVHTELSMDPDVGSLAATVNLDSSRLDMGIEVILKEFKKIVQEGITKEELQKAKDHYIGKYSISLESSHAKAMFYSEQEMLEKGITESGEIFEKIKKVTLEDVRQVAQDIFVPQKLNLAVIGPYDDKSRFEKLLENAL